MYTLETSIVGNSFRPAHARDLLAAVEIGDIVVLRREPDNRFDPHAIKVLYQTTHVGYVKAIDALQLSPELERRGLTEYTAEVIELGPHFTRILVEIEDDDTLESYSDGEGAATDNEES